MEGNLNDSTTLHARIQQLERESHIDPQHRYGDNLHIYYDVWFQSESLQPFFYWDDVASYYRVQFPEDLVVYLSSFLVVTGFIGMYVQIHFLEDD